LATLLPLSAVDIRQRLGANVRKLRHAKGWSQEDYADRAGIHRTYVSDIERGPRNPTATVIEKLARALEVSPGRLLD
jgi:transcriptional regulator with XRE-family HTH domain